MPLISQSQAELPAGHEKKTASLDREYFEAHLGWIQHKLACAGFRVILESATGLKSQLIVDHLLGEDLNVAEV